MSTPLFGLAAVSRWHRVYSGLCRATLCRATLLAAALLAGLALPGRVSAECPLPQIRLERIALDVWLVPGQPGEADAVNRGQVSNLVLVGDGVRLWALGSGPSPAFGLALACQVKQTLSRAITDVISPWTRPELVLGSNGLGQVRRWAHASVAAAMAEQCPQCVSRLSERLRGAASDLGPSPLPPLPPPSQRLQGESGSLGPLDWWRLPRSEQRWVTVWRVRAAPVWIAHGLLNANGPADGRDADLALLAESAERLVTLAATDGAAARWIGDQGPVADAGAPQRQADYGRTLLAKAREALLSGVDEAAPPPSWPGLPPGWAVDSLHALNWQRAWRQAEADYFKAPK